MKWNKLAAGLLALTMVGTGIPANLPLMTVCAAESNPASGTCGENVTWKFDESTGTLTISGDGAMADFETDAAPWRSFTGLKNVVVEKDVTSIGRNAFSVCESLTSVTILNPDCDIYAERATIANAVETGLLSVYKYSGVICGYKDSTAQAYAKQYNYKFELLEPDTGTCGNEAAWEFDDATNTLTISGTGEVNQAPWSVYKDKIEKAVIGDGITNVAGYAFNAYKKLTSVTIPDSVTTIGDKAFCDCTALKDVTLPNGLTSIGWDAFMNCSSVESLVIPDSVTEFGTAVFSGCTSLKSVTFPAGIKKIPGSIFQKCTGLTEITIPAGVEEIEGFAFSGTGLTSVEIPDSVTKLDGYAFTNCAALTDVTIPDSVTEIGCWAFSETPWLAAKRKENPMVVVNGILIDGTACKGKVAVPDGVTIIADRAFYETVAVTAVTLPESVARIGDRAFSYCNTLNSVTIQNPDCVIGSDVFMGALRGNGTKVTEWYDCCDILYGYAGSTAQKYAEDHSFTFRALSDVPEEFPTEGICGENVTWKFDKATGTLTVSGEGEIEAVPWTGFCEEIKTAVIAEGVENIGGCAFIGCTSLTSVTIPDSVTAIWHDAFYGCAALKEVTVPASVKSIGNDAFAECKALESVTILNPACTIYDEDQEGNTICNSTDAKTEAAVFTGIIYGAADSIAKTFAETYGYTFRVLGAGTVPTTEVTVGDVTGDSKIDASDAADLLVALAHIGAGHETGLNDAQTSAADADG
ncbi:MAG: leucine-rich repeat protein, partial [Oscillospiraceae bacterium]|nr:leucine-rich repeat protein [Oscillospiraceae bacterium]